IHFADHNYVPYDKHASPELQTLGTTAHGMQQLPNVQADIGALRSHRCEQMRGVLGEQTFTYDDFRTILHSHEVSSVRLHGLGPNGTNIAQACDLYLRNRRLP